MLDPSALAISCPTGLLFREDPRNALFPMSPRLPDPLLVSYPLWKDWGCPAPLTQEGNSCVGFSYRTDLEAVPIPVPKGVGPDGLTIYREAQARDGLPLPHEGTSLNAGGQYLKQAGMWQEYVWAQNIDDAIKWVLLRGPVVAGTQWLAGMDNYDSRFVLHPTGLSRGGHAWMIRGYWQREGYFLMQNTWSANWANQGRAWIFWKDLEDLVFTRGGQIVAPTEPGM
jgi:hypothetical protein